MENERVQQMKQVEKKTNLLTSSKYEGLAAELMIGFLVWNWSNFSY